MANSILTPSPAVQFEMGQLCALRVILESKQQGLLSRNIQLSRFMKLTSLEKLANSPEMEDVRKHMDQFLRNWRFETYRQGFSRLAEFYYPDFVSDN